MLLALFPGRGAAVAQGGGGRLRPQVSVGTRVTGTDRQRVVAVDTDASGSVAFVGTDVGAGAFSMGSSGVGSSVVGDGQRTSGFVARSSSAGAVAWIREITASIDLDVVSVAAAGDGSTYAAGTVQGSVRFLSAGAPVDRSVTAPTGFVVAYDPVGAVSWVRMLRSGDASRGFGLAAMPGGGVAFTGVFAGSAVLEDGGLGRSLVAASASAKDALVVRFDPAGGVLWAQEGDSPIFATGAGVGVDGSGAVFVTGVFIGAVTFGSLAALSASGADGYVVKFGADGVPAWSKRMGAASAAISWSVAVSPDGATVAASGLVSGPMAVATTPMTMLPEGGGIDAFVVVSDGVTGAPRWARSVAGSGTDIGFATAVDVDGSVFLGGSFSAGAAISGTPAPALVGAETDGFVVAFDPGGSYRWVDTVSSQGADAVNGLTLDPQRQLVVAGEHSRVAAVGAGLGSTTLQSGGLTDGFVSRVAQVGNTAPVAAPTSALTAPGRSVRIVAGGTDADGDALTVALAGGPAHGTLSAAPPAFDYLPDPGFEGVDAFSFTVADAYGGADAAVVSITVSSTNRLPQASDLTVPVVVGTATPVELSGSDPDLDPLTFAVDPPGPAFGTIAGVAPHLTYQPAPQFSGADRFDFSVDDGRGGVAHGTVVLDVGAAPPDRPPVATPGALSTRPGHTASAELRATDPDGDQLTFSLDSPGPSHGTVSLTGTTVTYTPDPGYRGADQVPFTVVDGRGGVVSSAVTVAVKPPNVVVILSDDQTLEQQRFLTKTNALLGTGGTTFTNFVVSFPECCPSRATLLSGQYAHNHGVLSSSLPTGGVTNFDDRSTLATWLQQDGYYTSLAGKYLNGYGRDVPASTVPPGWSDWYALVDPATYNYFDYDISANGAVEHFGSEDPEYSTDVLAAHTEQVIRAKGGGTQPFFALFAPTGPHVSNGLLAPVPAPRHFGSLPTATAPRTAATNEVDVSDKPPAIRSLAPVDPNGLAIMDWSYQRAAESLQAIDDATERIVGALAETGELDNTLIIFTSDNGLQYGEHRLFLGKSQPYEESIRVPLLVRGPGFDGGGKRSQPAVNVDLAATILGTTGTAPGLPGDGIDLTTYVASPTLGVHRSVLIENGPAGSRRTYKGVRDERFVYIEWSTGEREFYDLSQDPLELVNRASTPSYGLAVLNLSARLQQLRSCQASACRVGVT